MSNNVFCLITAELAWHSSIDLLCKSECGLQDAAWKSLYMYIALLENRILLILPFSWTSGLCFLMCPQFELSLLLFLPAHRSDFEPKWTELKNCNVQARSQIGFVSFRRNHDFPKSKKHFYIFVQFFRIDYVGLSKLYNKVILVKHSRNAYITGSISRTPGSTITKCFRSSRLGGLSTQGDAKREG